MNGLAPGKVPNCSLNSCLEIPNGWHIQSTSDLPNSMNSSQPDKFKTLLCLLIGFCVVLATILTGAVIWLAVRFLPPVSNVQPVRQPATFVLTQTGIVTIDRTSSSGGALPAFDAASFAPRFDISAASGQASIAFGDLDGDGKPDAVVANYSNRTMAVYKNTSHRGVINAASFASPVHFTVGHIPHCVQFADLDSDGKQDLMCVNEGGAELSLFRNTATAGVIDNNSFAAEVVLITPRDPRAVVAKDLNGDGKPDLIVASYGSGALSILPNESVPGAFLFGERVNLPNAPAGTLAVGDVDGDGKADIVIPSANTPVIWIYPNVNAGEPLSQRSFARRVSVPGHSAGVTLADMDGDGRLDLVSVDESANTLSVHRNVGPLGSINSESFADPVGFRTGGYPYMPIVARLDADNRPDVVVANASSFTISVYRNLSNPGAFTTESLTPRVDYPTGTGPRIVVVADIDGDGLADIANANLTQLAFSILRQVRSAR